MAEWLSGLGRSDVAALLGTLLLVLVAAVPMVSGRKPWVTMLAFVGGVIAAALVVDSGIAHGGWVPKDSDVSRHLKSALGRIRENVEHPTRNLLIIGGGSYVAYGVDPAAIERRLKQEGYHATVVQLGEPGANHLERRQLYEDLVDHPTSWLDRTPEKSKVILLEEVHRQYDREPMVQIGQNLGTARLSYYMTPRAAADALWSVYFGGGTVNEDVEGLEWTLVRHALVRGFNVGAVDRLGALSAVKGRGGYAPARARRFKFDRGKAAKRGTRSKISELDLPWLWEVREPGVDEAFEGLLDGWVYFAVPPTHKSYVEHSRAFCAQTKRPCIALDDPTLYDKLASKSSWHDAGHLSAAGARIYSRWLADELIASGVLAK